MASSIGENAQPTSTNDYILDVLREEANTQSVHTNDSAIDDSIRAEKTETKSTTKHNANSMPPPLLPPCRVCEEKASGFHYGVNTCEACKGFFRRSLQRHKPYRCKMNEKCLINGANLSAKCPKCRLEKCLEVGMSKEGIQRGRYNLEKKTEYIIEVKGKESMEITNPDFVSRKGDSERIEQSLNVPCRTLTQKHVVAFPEAVRKLLAVYDQVTYDTPEFQQKKDEVERTYFEKCHLEEELFGQMQALSIEEYLAVKKQTGLDIDGRSKLIVRFNEIAEDYTLRNAKFAKGLPHFDHFCLEDQIKITKHAYQLGAIDLLSINLWNFKKRLCHFPKFGEIFSFDDFDKIFHKQEMRIFFEFAGRVAALNLHTDELVLAVSVFTLLTDQLDLKEPEMVEASLKLSLTCLLNLLEKNHSSDKFVFPKLVSYITEYRQLSMRHNSIVNVEETFDIKMDPIFHEMNKINEI